MTVALEAPPLARAVAERSLTPSADPALTAATARLVAAAGQSLLGLLFFGSRRTGAAKADVFSAYDVIVVVTGYAAFYRAIRAAGLTGKSPLTMAFVSRILAPTQVSLPFEAEGVHVKATVVDGPTLVRETSPARRDHFCAGRLFQPASLLFARDEPTREMLVGCLGSAVRETWSWSRPWLPASFTSASYGLSALDTSLHFEVRPEPKGRGEQLWAAQRDLQLPVLEALLRELAARGELVAAGPEGTWSARRPVGWLERLRLNAYFRFSMARTTARWLKHIVSFEGWLDYIVRKASRHSGETFELTERERRFPLLLLWGRVFRYLSEHRKGRRKER
jgi:hypothetical protein